MSRPNPNNPGQYAPPPPTNNNVHQPQSAPHTNFPIDPSLLPNNNPYPISNTATPQPQPAPGSYHASHLPPPYAPVDYPQHTPHTARSSSSGVRPTISPSHSDATASSSVFSSTGGPAHHTAPTSRTSEGGKQGDDTYPSIMVYPPPPPHPGQKYEPPSLFSKSSQESMHQQQLPERTNVTSWGPPSASMQEGWWDGAKHARRPSDAEEVEAGLALAGMGMAAMQQVKVNRDSDQEAPLAQAGTGGRGGKKAKRENGAPGGKKGETAAKEGKEGGSKDGKKSCAECRRLKAKCDRVFPCSNCRRRGCALVCPDGDLSCMQGKRLVLASTEQLHDRIAQLETALFQAHSKTAPGHHPLLAPEYLDGGFASLPPPASLANQRSPPFDPATMRVKSDPSSPPAPANLSPKDRSSASSFQVVTPKMSSERGASQGRMAVESLLLSEEQARAEGKREDEWVGENAAPAMIVGTVGQSKESGDERHRVFERLNKILRVLPPRAETRRRAAGFWRSSSWYNTMVQQDEFDNIYEPAVYAPTPQNPLSPHKLAVVLMVLTLDTYFDVTIDEESPIIATYWEGAQQCFDTRFGWAASVAGVQALGLATLFVGFGWRGARASNFYWLRQMTSSALQLGLHKDPHPSLPEDEREFRRRVFHESYTLDCLISINHGQRTAVSLENIEAAMPVRVHPRLLLKYEYMRAVKSTVIELGCKPDSALATWEQISQCEEIMMKFDVGAHPEAHCLVLSGQPMPTVPFDEEKTLDVDALIRCTTSMCHYKAMLFLYRPCLRRLVARLRTQPREQVSFSEQDRRTVAVTYRACHAITLISAYMARSHPKVSSRFWAVWVQTFSAAVSMAALAIWCGPHLEPTFTSSAYGELSQACDMIRENGCRRSMGVQSLLPILQNLVAQRYPQVVGRPIDSASVSLEGEDMLFALLGGQVDQRAPQPTAPEAHLQPIGQTYPQHPQQNAASWQGYQTATQPPLQQQQQQPPTNFYSSHQQTTTSEWHVSVPVVPAHPANAMPYFQASHHHAQQPNHHSASLPRQPLQPQEAAAAPEKPVEEMSPTELWARLQTFYEPSPAFWGHQVGMEREMGVMGGNIAQGEANGVMMGGQGGDGSQGWVDYMGVVGMSI